jgi:hypothetical protein
MIPGAVDLQPSRVFALALDSIAVGMNSVSSVAEHLAVSHPLRGGCSLSEMPR